MIKVIPLKFEKKCAEHDFNNTKMFEQVLKIF